jgi:hypothetical protein
LSVLSVMILLTVVVLLESHFFRIATTLSLVVGRVLEAAKAAASGRRLQ